MYAKDRGCCVTGRCYGSPLCTFSFEDADGGEAGVLVRRRSVRWSCLLFNVVGLPVQMSSIGGHCLQCRNMHVTTISSRFLAMLD